jgi:hypothetical protein
MARRRRARSRARAAPDAADGAMPASGLAARAGIVQAAWQLLGSCARARALCAGVSQARILYQPRGRGGCAWPSHVALCPRRVPSRSAPTAASAAPPARPRARARAGRMAATSPPPRGNAVVAMRAIAANKSDMAGLTPPCGSPVALAAHDATAMARRMLAFDLNGGARAARESGRRRAARGGAWARAPRRVGRARQRAARGGCGGAAAPGCAGGPHAAPPRRGPSLAAPGAGLRPARPTDLTPLASGGKLTQRARAAPPCPAPRQRRRDRRSRRPARASPL